MKNRLFPLLIVALVGLSLLTGCSIIGYNIGKAIDPKDTTYSIRDSLILDQFVGENVTFLIDKTPRKGIFEGVSLVVDSNNIGKVFYLNEIVRRAGKKVEQQTAFPEDQLQDIQVTRSRGSAKVLMGGLGTVCDIMMLLSGIFIVGFGHAHKFHL